MEKLFKLKANGTTAKTEIIAGLTAFMTMAYMVALNPNLLTNFTQGSLWNGVFMATCIASAIAMFCMAFLANKPFVLAPGMGLNNFFAIVVGNIVTVTGMTYLEAYQSALIIILLEGVIFLILSFLKVRDKIVDAIPVGVRLGIAPAIGLMLMNIGLGSNAGVISEKGEKFFVLRDFFGAINPTNLAENAGESFGMLVLTVITMLVGLFVIVVLSKKNIKGSVLLGMLVASVIYWVAEFIFFGNNPFAGITAEKFIPPFADMAETTLFKFNWQGFLSIGWATIVTLIITFCIIDMFDTIGTLVGAATRSGMVDEQGNMPQMKEALMADSIGTIAGACTGTSTVTTLAESAAGIEAGGRTGLTSLTAGILFLACIFIAPIAAVIPAPATSAALIYVGVLMLQGLKEVDFDDVDQFLPVALMLIAMPVSGSIGNAIGLGLIAYTVIKVFSGKFKDVSVLTYIISLIFLVKFFLVV